MPLDEGGRGYDALVELAGDARVVLIGEATHGTHEFYRARAEITQRLMEDEGFDAVALEADWPNAYRVDRYVRGAEGAAASADEALAGFRDFPHWMWRNEDVEAFVDWLRERNAAVAAAEQAGFYGLDV